MTQNPENEPAAPRNVLLFGVTGMIGQGVLRESVRDSRVRSILSIGRNATGARHPKLRQLLHADLFHYHSVEPDLTGFDACFFCLGISSAGKSEAEYTRITRDLTLAAAETLARLNPAMTFIYVSGAGANTKSRAMWARVKAETEQALAALPFKAVYSLRPGLIVPMHGVRSRTRLYRVIYTVIGPSLSLARSLFPNQLLTTEQIGRAMINLVAHGAPRAILEARDIRAVARMDRE